MPSRHPTCAGALVVTLVFLCLAVPSAAQGAGRGWILTAGGGYATRLDERGSFSLSASVLRAQSRTLSLGVEGGYDRYQAFEQAGKVWWNGTNVTSSECPTPCTWQRVTMTSEYINAAWHIGGVLRYTHNPARALVPSAEVGVGLYGLHTRSGMQTEDATTAVPVPQLSDEGSSTDLAPGVSGALGVDVFPGNGRIGFGAVASLRAAGRPATDAFLSVGFASVQARVTVR